MISRRAITALAMGALTGVLVTAAGCGADECTKASEHFSQCLGTDTEDDGITASAPRCEHQYLCSSRCVNASDCATLQDAFGPHPKADNSYLACRAKVNTTPECLSEQ